MTKRQKFFIATFILLIGVIIIRLGLGQFLPWRGRVVIFTISSILISLWALHDEDFKGIEWFTLPILPTSLAIGSILVYPLLPTRLENLLWITLSPDTSLIFGFLVRMLFLILFSVSYYASLLTGNIYNVAAVRSIQLLRVAHSIGFLLTVMSGLFFFLVISSLHLNSSINFILISLISFFLSIQAIWSINLEPKIGENVRNFSLLVALVIGEISWILSFWPLTVSMFALFLTAIFYELVGIIQYEMGEKLNPKIANEFIVVAIAVFLLTILVTEWGGV